MTHYYLLITQQLLTKRLDSHVHIPSEIVYYYFRHFALFSLTGDSNGLVMCPGCTFLLPYGDWEEGF